MAKETSIESTKKSPLPREKSVNANKKRSGNKKRWILRTIFGLVFIALIGSTAFFYYQYSLLKNDPSKATREEVKALVMELDKIMQLPGDEDPTLATVTDAEKLKEEPFFINAQSGDKVLMYNKAKKVILYRPSTKKIIEVAPLTSNNASTDITEQKTSSKNQESVSASNSDQTNDENEEVDRSESSNDESNRITVVMYNGTETVGYTYTLEERLLDIENIEVIQRESAKESNYTETLVVNISNTNDEVVTEIADALNANISNLPVGEIKPDADILIIGGSKE
jgi:hypothetical protein